MVGDVYTEWRNELDRWVIGRVECEDAGKEEVVVVGLDGYVHGVNGLGNDY